MPRPVILAAALALAVTPAFGQVKVDLHALDALPHKGGKPPPARAVTHPAPNSPQAAESTAATPAPPALPSEVPPAAALAPLPAETAPPAATAASAAVPATEAAQPTAPAAPASVRIAFASGKADLTPDGTQSIKQFAGSAPKGGNGAINGAINVAAYAAGSPDDASTARRLSLSRALAVRDALIQDGIPSARIYVRALGSQAGSGPADRVDISMAGGSLQPAAAQ